MNQMGIPGGGIGIFGGIAELFFFLIVAGLFVWGFVKSKNAGFMVLTIWGGLKFIGSIFHLVFIAVLVREMEYEVLQIMNVASFIMKIILGLVFIVGLLLLVLKINPKTR